MYGRVTKYFTDRGYGFIRGGDNNSYFNILSKEKQSELIGRKDDFAKKAGITP